MDLDLRPSYTVKYNKENCLQNFEKILLSGSKKSH